MREAFRLSIIIEDFLQLAQRHPSLFFLYRHKTNRFATAVLTSNDKSTGSKFTQCVKPIGPPLVIL